MRLKLRMNNKVEAQSNQKSRGSCFILGQRYGLFENKNAPETSEAFFILFVRLIYRQHQNLHLHPDLLSHQNLHLRLDP